MIIILFLGFVVILVAILNSGIKNSKTVQINLKKAWLNIIICTILMIGSTIYMFDTNNFDQYGLTWGLCLPIYIGLICFCSYQLGYYFPTIYKNIKKKKTTNN